MTTDDRWILIVGYGSIGRRHFQNAQRLGWSDIRLLRTSRNRVGAFETPAGARAYAELDSAISDQPFAAIVANPSSLHAMTASRLLQARIPVLLEKPVSATIQEARDVAALAAECGIPCSVAYCFRYHPLYRSLHDLAAAGVLGRIFHARSWWASYLPSWHPWEDFRISYAARSELGGGVVRTLDHEMDMLRWLLGQPRNVIASAGSLGGLGLDVEDTADMIFRFETGVEAQCHVSFARRDLSRGMSLVGERASATLDWSGGTLTVADDRSVLDQKRIPPDFDLNQIYTEMLHEALQNFGAAAPRAPIPVANGVAALEMALAALESNRMGTRISLIGVNDGKNG